MKEYVISRIVVHSICVDAESPAEALLLADEDDSGCWDDWDEPPFREWEICDQADPASENLNSEQVRAEYYAMSAAAKAAYKRKIVPMAEAAGDAGYRGGRCARCGYNRCMAALVFHHRDPLLKRFAISGGGDCRYDISRGTTGRTREEILEELDRCVVLCGNCHGELHAGLWNIDELATTKT